MRAILLSGVVVLAVFSGPPAGAEAPREQMQKEHAKLAGTWSVIRGEMDGHPLPQSEIDGLTLTFKNGAFTARRGKEEPQRGSYRIDPGKAPCTMDIERKDGPEHGRKQAAIYTVTGNRLEICSAPAGQQRPAAFSTRGQQGCTLLQLRREP